MSNKKLSRLLEPNLKFYFAVMLLFAVAAIPVNWQLALAEGTLTVLLYFYFRQSNQKRRQGVLQYIDSVTGSVDTASKSTLINSPLPIMVFRPDTGEVIWSNENFLQLAGVREHLFEMKVEDAVPDFPVQWMLEGKQECPDRVVMNSRRFRVYGSLVRAKGRGAEQNLVATTYWVDTTEADDLRERYTATRPVLAILMVDNYEDLMKACADTQRSAVLAQIDEKLNNWAACADGLLLKTERDHYLFIFEECHYDHFVEEKFSILDAIREIKVGDVCPTLSIGIGKDADAMAELYRNARLSLEMALSRGGDQAVVRGKVDFQFYGGRSKSTEKRTKVKSRVMANALGELIDDAKQVYVMGHKYADMDSVGAAMGVCCIARKRGKKCQIVIDTENNAAHPLIRKMAEQPEYAGVMISGGEAFLKCQPGALLVVVDTNRPESVESEEMLETCNRVAVIDHHRRGSSYIEKMALNYHEPYASSACELVTELLQYIAEPTDLLRTEAEALLAGIVLDTKNFTMRTGGRTFEAAAFLRRSGADTGEVKRLFQNDLSGTIAKYDIIQNAKLYRDHIAIAVVDHTVGRVTAAQAADELLNIVGISTSFVLFPDGEQIIISGRSMGDTNVQVILEQLGGGGNAAAAGGQVAGKTLEQVAVELTQAIDRYLEEAS